MQIKRGGLAMLALHIRNRHRHRHRSRIIDQYPHQWTTAQSASGYYGFGHTLPRSSLRLVLRALAWFPWASTISGSLFTNTKPCSEPRPSCQQGTGCTSASANTSDTSEGACASSFLFLHDAAHPMPAKGWCRQQQMLHLTMIEQRLFTRCREHAGCLMTAPC